MKNLLVLLKSKFLDKHNRSIFVGSVVTYERFNEPDSVYMVTGISDKGIQLSRDGVLISTNYSYTDLLTVIE